MKIIEKIFDNETFYYIGEFSFKFGKIYKFSNKKETIFCTKQDEDFGKITDKRIMKKILKEFQELKIKDVI